ncbi:MAG: phage major capsid protein [Chitinispirillia bacterium]|nr:phage major capsid protein [Chitinispirillia bacterium]
MRDINKMKRERAEKIAAMRAMLDTAETREDKSMTAEERSSYDALEAKANQLVKDIDEEQRLLNLEASTATPVAPAVIPEMRKDEEGKMGFRDVSEFLHTVVASPSDSRLQQRTSTMGNMSSIGYVVPPDFDTTIREVSPSDAIVRPRALVIKGNPSSPDAPTNLVALDQSGDLGFYSGVSVFPVGEIEERQQSADPKVRQITLQTKEIAAYIPMSNDLLNNSVEAAPLIERLFRKSIIAYEDKAFLLGNGQATALGFIGHTSNAAAARKSANTITTDDIVEMDALTLDGIGGDYYFIVSKAAKPTLRKLKDDAGQLIWQDGLTVGSPATLLGHQVLYSERTPAIGTQGDITLVNFNAYAIKNGSPLTIFVDPYTMRKFGQTVIWAGWHFDGQPLLNSPIKGEDGIKRSAFVTLTAPATVTP